ncbi:SDR family NAD(P)-dependent oxidoreductase [Streptomyces sp. NPDC048281]|uniref:SDR family NAD(P)-dependent oxidoreductase n=1 Tax=Streptomyces sp. NPDC048281 TaxID=3154715 RepID=UPI003442B44D
MSSTLDRLSLDGKVAVVTGGAGAIGQVYGRALAEAGASVVLADLNAEGAEQAAKTLAADGLRALGVRVDITDRASAADMAAKATDAFGGIDILVNNAALMAETVPLHSHVTAALHSGDVTKEEMDEIVLQFSAYYGFAKGEALAATVETAWTSRPD